jgi:hypothetical protein
MPPRAAVHCLHTHRWPRRETGPRHNRIAPIAIRRMPGQFVPSPKNLMLRRGGSRVSRTGREESGPLSGPRQRVVRAMYKTPPRTSSAPSPIRNILASQFIAATHNRTRIQAPGGAVRSCRQGGSDRRGSPSSERRQSLGSSAGRCSGARWTYCGGPGSDDRAGDRPRAGTRLT